MSFAQRRIHGCSTTRHRSRTALSAILIFSLAPALCTAQTGTTPAAAATTPATPCTAAPATTTTTTPPAISIIGRITEGTTVISGVADKGASIEVVEISACSLLELRGGGASVTADKTTGAFTITLAEPLYGGQHLQFRVETTAAGSTFAPASIGGDATPTEFIVRALGDWGRVRAEFAFGAVLSFDNNFQLYSTSTSTESGNSSSSANSSQATLFLDFNVEKNWVWAGVKGPDTVAGKAKAGAAKPPATVLGVSTPANPPANPAIGKQTKFELTRHVMFSTFFETRLTSIPVSVCQNTAPTTTTPTTNSLAPRPAAATTTTTATTSSSPCNPGTGGVDALTTFLNSAKSAELQGGAYLPILTSVWSYQGTPNALFIAPIARVGFLTPTGSTTSGSTSVQPVNSANFYNFYAFGGRVGHYTLSSDKNSAPALQTYLDVMWGRYSNLETLEQLPNGIASVRRWRLAIEGVLKVPSTPLVLGVSANIGQNLNGPPTVLAAKDDLRFFIGAKFDIGKVLAKLPQF